MARVVINKPSGGESTSEIDFGMDQSTGVVSFDPTGGPVSTTVNFQPFPYKIAQLRDVKAALTWAKRSYPRKDGNYRAAIMDIWNRTPAVLRYYRPLKKAAAQFGLSGMGCGCSAPASLAGLGNEAATSGPQLDTADKITKTANAIFGIVNSAAKNYFTIRAMNKMKDGVPLTVDQAVNQESWLDRNKSFVIGGIIIAAIAAFLFFKKR